MADDKTKPTKLSVAAFIDTLADPARRGDAKALVKLKSRRCGGGVFFCRTTHRCAVVPRVCRCALDYATNDAPKLTTNSAEPLRGVASTV